MDESLRARFSVLLATLSIGAACDAKGGTTPPEPATTEGVVDVAQNGDAGDKAEHQCGDHAEGACAGDKAEPATAAPTQPTKQKLSVKPGDFAEVNFTLVAGSTISAGYLTDGAPTKWNVHSHGPNHEAVIHSEGNDAKGKLEFTAPGDGVFSFLWVNEGKEPLEIEIDVVLSEGAQIHSWMPAAN